MTIERTREAAVILDEGRKKDWDHLRCALSTLLPEAVQVVAEAYHKEPNWRERESLLHLLWELRDPAAISTLAEALNDLSNRIWKEALDGLVVLGTPFLSSLELARDAQPPSSAIRRWLDEAIEQIQEDARENAE